MVQESNRWMESSDVIPMFPSLVWKVQIEASLRDALATNIRAALADLRRGLPPLEAGRGWQSRQALHEREDFRDLVLCVRRGVTSILRFLRIGYDAFEITACWATALAKGAAHKVHSHPNNFLSGVYYVCTQPGADTINFHDPRRRTAVIRPPVVRRCQPELGRTNQHLLQRDVLFVHAAVEHTALVTPARRP